MTDSDDPHMIDILCTHCDASDRRCWHCEYMDGTGDYYRRGHITVEPEDVPDMQSVMPWHRLRYAAYLNTPKEEAS
jgi:hypothetical protein